MNIIKSALAQGLSGIQPFAGTAQSNLPTAITNIINVLLILAALIAGIYMILGGVKYITSGSDPGGQDKAIAARGFRRCACLLFRW